MKLIANLLRKKENKFDHIISLGYNCEVSFRFLKYFKFEESGLFNWVYIKTINDLIYSLNNFESIGTGDFELPNPLWECKNTHIRFHGKANMSLFINNTAPHEIIEQDRKDLKERLEHFKDKFLKFAKDDSSKLYIYKIKDGDFNKENVCLLSKALSDLGANNYKLLIVYQKSVKDVLDDFDNVIFRSVEYFADDNDVTNKKYKKNGWDKIYDEFYVRKPKGLIKKKKYKFDKE